jgi:hypothetical protein
MRVWPRLLLALALVSACVLAVLGYLSRERLIRQWRAYQVGRAADFGQAARDIAWFEAGPDRQAKLRELVAKWGTGNPRFDLYLARYVVSPESSEALRQDFSLEFAWRDGLLARWAQYWSFRAGAQADGKIEEILTYVDMLDAAKEPLKEISWREILDLQAIFCLTGQPRQAERLTPANWRDRYRQWRQTRPATLPHVPKPAQPLPDWDLPIPEWAS